MEVPDEALVRRCLAGNKNAFDTLVERHKGAAYGLAFHYVGRFSEAEDLAQEAFVQAYVNLARLREPSRFGAWLKGITANLCKMFLRSRQSERASLEEMAAQAESEPTADDILQQSEVRQQVRQALASLSEKNRLAVTLYYIDGLTYQEMANFLEVPVSTIKGRLHKARRQLREELVSMVKDDFQEHRLAEDFTEKAAALLRGLGNKRHITDWEGWDRSRRELVAMGQSGVDAVIEGLKDSDWSIRRWSAGVLGEIGGAQALEALIQAANDRHKRVRCAALRGVVACGSGVADDQQRNVVLPLLTDRLLHDPNKYVRRVAAICLAYVGDRQALVPLIRALSDPAPIVRRLATWTIQVIAGVRRF